VQELLDAAAVEGTRSAVGAVSENDEVALVLGWCKGQHPRTYRIPQSSGAVALELKSLVAQGIAWQDELAGNTVWELKGTLFSTLEHLVDALV